MADESGPVSGEPIDFHGGGWVYERVDGEIAVHREGVDPRSCDAGDCLYLSPEELLGFCAVASFAGEVLLAEGATATVVCPLVFEVDGRVVFRAIGVSPQKGERVLVPEEAAAPIERTVVDIRASYTTTGRTVFVVCR
jgi:hypothetical protein